SVVKLYAAAMFPGLFLAFLYILYVVSRALFNPALAPGLPEELTRIPVPGWLQKFQAAYSRNVFVALVMALFSPGRAAAIETENGRLGYGKLLANFLASLVPFLLMSGVL